MAKIGYARVSTIGQKLDVQLEKLTNYGCTKIFEEKISATNLNRPEYKKCLDYIREGDTLVITRLDRLARSVNELSKLADRFNNERINFVVIDQNIDTSTSTGRLMFNMLACIAEFENDLRLERQQEGIQKAKANGIKFGRPKKITEGIKNEILLDRDRGMTINQISKKFQLGEASIYRILKQS